MYIHMYIRLLIVSANFILQSQTSLHLRSSLYLRVCAARGTFYFLLATHNNFHVIFPLQLDLARLVEVQTIKGVGGMSDGNT
jgi:hypothetical protein